MIIYLDKKLCKSMNERCAFLRERERKRKKKKRRIDALITREPAKHALNFLLKQILWRLFKIPAK